MHSQADVGSKIKFGRVLALKKDGKFDVGTPYLESVGIEAEILEELRGPKVTGSSTALLRERVLYLTGLLCCRLAECCLQDSLQVAEWAG